MRSTFTPGVKRGITTGAQAQALRVVGHPCAWLPALMATTPRARSSAVSSVSFVAGPALLERGGELQVLELRNTCAPTICERAFDSTRRVQHLAL